MTTPEKRMPGGSPAFADHSSISAIVSVLPLPPKAGVGKTAHNRYVRLFLTEMYFAIEHLDAQEYRAWSRIAAHYVANDGVLLALDKVMAQVTKTGKKWPDLRDKLLALGLGRIENGHWVDEHQRSSLELQRRASLRGRRGADARWEKPHGP